MNCKLLVLWVMIAGLLFAPGALKAEPAIINDIVVDTQNATVKITITSSQTLQIETFKNEESPANYIVLDFLGTVYTKLPPIIEVGRGAVEKVSLVRGEDAPLKIGDTEYYALDFLAINLNAKADYQVRQSQSVIDLDIATTSGSAVQLTPPIVVSKERTTSSSPEKKYAAQPISYGEEYASTPESGAGLSTEPTVKKKKRRGLFKVIFGRKKAKTPQEPAVEAPVEEVRKPPVAVQPERYEPVTSSSSFLLDRVVNDTIREKEQISGRIQSLTMELQRLQEELNLSKGEKSKLDSKITEILAKLDELQSALDEEIRRRQSLGEKVEDLIARRDAYVKAKLAYEALAKQFNEVSVRTDRLNIEVQSLKSRLDVAQFEKKKLEDDVATMSTSYTQAQADYDAAVSARDSLSVKIEQLTQELEALRQRLDKETEERTRISTQLKGLDSKNKYNSMELSRLKQLLLDKNAQLSDMLRQYDQMKAALDAAVSDKFKVEYSYRNAKTEFERIKQEIEAMLSQKH
ncbi:MAG: hypothetical protein PHO30_05095 [Candidatus Omnitrophica bacterium]|nr:hypothetical protein [Candidatus Omnitrophota bacterium]